MLLPFLPYYGVTGQTLPSAKDQGGPLSGAVLFKLYYLRLFAVIFSDARAAGVWVGVHVGLSSTTSKQINPHRTRRTRRYLQCTELSRGSTGPAPGHAEGRTPGLCRVSARDGRACPALGPGDRSGHGRRRELCCVTRCSALGTRSHSQALTCAQALAQALTQASTCAQASASGWGLVLGSYCAKEKAVFCSKAFCMPS